MPANVKTESSIEVPTMFEFLELASRVSALESGGGGSGVTIQEYNTGNNSELVTVLPGDDTKHVVYSQHVPNLKAGEILIVLCEVECTNDNIDDLASRFSTQVILSETQTGTTGTEINEGQSYNLTRDMHHGVFPRMGTFVVPYDGFEREHVNLRAWVNRELKVEQDYGRLSVIRVTPS